MNINEFIKKYGYRGLSLLVGKFIEKAPEFEGDKEMAEKIGTMLGDLEVALENTASQ